MMSTTDTTAETQALLAKLPATARHYIYVAAVAIGAFVFVATIVLDATGHATIDGIRLDPATGGVGAILTFLGLLAHANLSTGGGIIAALEEADPKAAEVLDAAQTTVEKAQELAAAHPDLANMLKAELRTVADKYGVHYTSKTTKAKLIALIEAASKTEA